MMISNDELILGYDYDVFLNSSGKHAITTDIGIHSNSHCLITGLSGSAKSSGLLVIFARLIKLEKDGVFFFADFKRDDMYSFLRSCSRYFCFDECIKAIDIVYDILINRQSGKDVSRYSVTLVFDEYPSFIFYLLEIDKKVAEICLKKIANILMLGRSLAVRIISTCQRPDANIYKNGARINFGIIIILGSSAKSTYEMLLDKEFIEEIGDRKFNAGEGVLLLQGSKFRFLKMPIIRNEDKLKELCIAGLSD